MAVTRDTPIAGRFREIARAMPSSIALTSRRAQHTYASLDGWSDAIAARLLARGLSREQPVAIVTRDPIALVPAALGVVKAGYYFVVVDAADPAPRIDAIRAAANASEVLEICDPPEETAPAIPEAEPHPYVQVMFTSGTTGTPKPMLNPQRGFVERVVLQSEVTGRAAGERVSYTALPGFARATYEIFGSLLNGATLCSFDARLETLDALAELIARERITILTLTPALFRRFMKTIPPELDLSSIRKLRIGADVVTPADVEAFKARFPRTCTLERGFNATETGMVMHMSIDHDTPIPGPLVPIGRPRPNVEVRVVDEQGRDVNDDEVGELIVRSAFVFDGSAGADGLNTFATGDLVKRDSNGLYYFIGRKDSRLKIHGRRIDPLEVESGLIAHAAVREAVAVAKPGSDGEMHLVAYIVMQPGVPFSARAIRAALRDRVPSHLIPAHLYELDLMPMTPAGKVDRKALVARADEEEARDAGATDELEATLIGIWSQVTGRTVTIHDDFFDDLGGESVVAAHLVTQVRRVLGRSMPLSLLLELSTVAKMADYLRARREADLEQTAILVKEGSGSEPPLFCVSGKGGSVVVFRELAKRLDPDQTFYGLTHHGLSRTAFPKTFAALAACYADTIRTIQPEGPYFLAGYSAGGLVAFDIARQLSRAGHEVAFVGIMDAAARPQHVARWKRYAKRAILLRNKPVQSTKRYLRSFALRAKNLVKKATPTALEERNRIYDTIARRTSMEPYSGRVTLFLARHGWGFDGTSRDLGWTPLAGELEIIDVDGEHATILRDDVDSLGSAMRNVLQRLRVSS